MIAGVTCAKSFQHLEQDYTWLENRTFGRLHVVAEKLSRGWTSAPTTVLRGLVQKRDASAALLGEHEIVTATCYFSNYYTFATGEHASKLMFTDRNDIATMRRQKEEGAGYEDLTIISGDRLRILEDTGIEGAGSNGPGQNGGTVSFERIEDIKAHVHSEMRKALDQLVIDTVPYLTSDEDQVLRLLHEAISSTFNRGVLKQQ